MPEIRIEKRCNISVNQFLQCFFHSVHATTTRVISRYQSVHVKYQLTNCATVTPARRITDHSNLANIIYCSNTSRAELMSFPDLRLDYNDFISCF